MNKRTTLLSLPNELLLYHVFIYLNSTDLLHVFSQLYNRRLNALLCAHIHHIDFLTNEKCVISTDEWLRYLLSLKTNTILSVRINLDHIDYPLSSIFPSLNCLDLQMTTASEKVSQMFAFTRLKILSITLTCEQPETIKGLASSIWNPDSYLESLSTSNCFILDKDDLFPTTSHSLMINQNLTRLSLDLCHICCVIDLMPFVPALEHLEVRLHNIYNERAAFKLEFLQRQEWPTKVRSLRLIAYDQLFSTKCFCAFVKRFSLSLERLSFYISTNESYLMSTGRKLELHLLDYLPYLKWIEFCVHASVRNIEANRRQTFDRWTKKQVVSIFYAHQFLTRFTMPFAFDRLENVSNDFVNYYCNYHQSDAILSLPSIVMITFDCNDKLNLAVFTLIWQTCPSLRHLRFKDYCNFGDDLIHDTKLTLTTVTELCLGDVTCFVDFSVIRRVLSLTPNLKHLTVRQHHITDINTMSNDFNILGHISKVTIIESRSYFDNN